MAADQSTRARHCVRNARHCGRASTTHSASSSRVPSERAFTIHLLLYYLKPKPTLRLIDPFKREDCLLKGATHTVSTDGQHRRRKVRVAPTLLSGVAICVIFDLQDHI